MNQDNRDSLQVMGKIWPRDAIARHQGTADYGNIATVDESPLRQGLLYVGTDDGVVSVSRDGGSSWTRYTKFPGVPDQTYVSRVVASKLNEGTVYASLLRLMQSGWISAKWGASENNRKAKFYSVTKGGRAQLARETEQWQRFSGVVGRVLQIQADCEIGGPHLYSTFTYTFFEPNYRATEADRRSMIGEIV